MSNGIEVTAGKIKKWMQFDACMRYRNFDIDETPLQVARDCPQYEHLNEELYRASTEELRNTWPACFWCTGIAPRDQAVYKRNTAFPDFDYGEPGPPTRTPVDVAAEFHRPDHHGKFRMVVAGDGACPNQGTKLARAWQGAFTVTSAHITFRSAPKAHARAPTEQSLDVFLESFVGLQYRPDTSRIIWPSKLAMTSS